MALQPLFIKGLEAIDCLRLFHLSQHTFSSLHDFVILIIEKESCDMGTFISAKFSISKKIINVKKKQRQGTIPY